MTNNALKPVLRPLLASIDDILGGMVADDRVLDVTTTGVLVVPAGEIGVPDDKKI